MLFFEDTTAFTQESLVLAKVTQIQLPKMIHNKISVNQLQPITGLNVIFDSNNRPTTNPNTPKDTYNLVTTKSFATGFAYDRNSRQIPEIIISYLNLGYLSYPKINRYSFTLPSIQNSSVIDQIININTATKNQLEALPGIKPKIAQNIIDYRILNGLFESSEQIIKVKGIGEKKYALIKDLIKVR